MFKPVAFRSRYLNDLPLDEYNELTAEHSNFAHEERSSVDCPVEGCSANYILIVNNSTTKAQREGHVRTLRGILSEAHPDHGDKITLS